MLLARVHLKSYFLHLKSYFLHLINSCDIPDLTLPNISIIYRQTFTQPSLEALKTAFMG